MRKRKIMQIMPADGWQAVFRDQNGADSFEPIVCFALIWHIYSTDDEALEYHVIPMVSSEKGIVLADENPHYVTAVKQAN
ncbi:hypothetical protein [Beggiatoa leptomitoformis]|uniref:Uncharacterized protein n=1 Tax=Beggiatoa leptomitoformis TaxID=288004 RepID=A0A2N9YAH2_9GAMM|nr:hypothetical protein [Beggiatoa leptomitoformis]ALG67128.1 hypothetical protein AL038_04650 [Beggiatoa leptomitoformis]AUI67473.1 hypothetical protein BLE401_01355 [Beggiatoa leptomitoformis]